MILKHSFPYFFILLAFFVSKDEPFVQTGMASYYHDKFHNRPTTSGEKYDKNELTAAHKTLPFGTILLVTNLKNDSTVLVRVNDRIGTDKRIIDLSKAAAIQLNFVRDGLAKVRIEKIVREPEIIQNDTSLEVSELLDNGVKPENSETILAGQNLMEQNCVRCHKLKQVNQYTPQKWDKILPKMASKAKITADEQEKIRTYIQWKLEN